MSKFTQCVANVKQLFPKASDKFIELSAKKMMELVDKYGNSPQLLPELQKFWASEIKSLAVYEKVKLDNKLKKSNIENMFKDAKNKNISAVEVAAALLVRSNKNIKDARISADVLLKGYVTEGNGILSQLVEIDNVSDIIDGKFDEDIANFMVDEGKNGTAIGTYNGPVKQVGQIFRTVNSWAIQTLRDSGIPINEVAGYIMRQSHDSERIEAAGFQTWITEIIPRLDMEKTFSDLDPNSPTYSQDVIKYLEATFKAIVADKGTGGVSRFTKGRQLHFKSGADFIQYNQQFGMYDTIFDSIKGSIKAVSRAASLTQVLGTNHRKTVDWLKSQADNKDKLVIEEWYQAVLGADEAVGEHQFTKVLDAGKMILNMSKLGGAAKSVLLDFVPAVIAHGQLTGGNIFETSFNSLGTWMESLSPDVRKEVAKELVVDLEIQHAALNNMMYGSADGIMAEYGKGAIAKAHKWFFTINGMGPLTRVNKTSASLSIARDLKDVIKKPLDKVQQTIFSHYGIGEKELKVMGLVENDFVNKKGIRMIPFEKLQEAFPDLKEQELLELQKDTGTKVMALLIDRADQMVPTAGKRERVQMGYIHHPDSTKGRIWRMVAQFKMTTMKSFNDMNYQANLYESRVPQAYLIGRRVIYGGLMAYMIESVRQYMFEDEPEYKPLTIQDGLEYLARGGGAGIAGDFVLGKHDTMVRKGVEGLAGPMLTTIFDAGDLASMSLGDKPVGREAAKLIIHNTPYLGLPFIKSYKDGMIDAMDEFLSEMTPYRRSR